MVWNPRLGPYKNAITNELFIAASIGMYLYFPGDNNTSSFMIDGTQQAGLDPVGRFDEQHREAAMKGYDWLKNSGMTNKKGLYVDGFHVRDWKHGGTKCDIRNEMVYTYNQGVLLSAMRGLWEGTGNRSYLEDGHELARNAIKATGWDLELQTIVDDNEEWAGLGRGGILEDRCDAAGRCNQDAQTFKGIFMHHLALLCEPLPLRPAVPGKTFCADKELAFLHGQSCKQYSRWVAHNAKAALNTRDERGRFGPWWGVKSGHASEPSPEGATDYRNNASELLHEPWVLKDESSRMDTKEDLGARRMLLHAVMSASQESERYSCSGHEAYLQSDPNDRGRGRTVEAQSGGVAVLRALWELRHNE